MNLRTLILRSLQYRWRSHLGVLMGSAIGSAALIGALVVGDSVRGSLRAQALQRLGWVTAAMAPADRYFNADLPLRILPPPAPGSAEPSDLPRLVAALSLPGTASRQDGAARANRVHVLGVASNFWPATAAARLGALPARSVILNEALAAQLNAEVGDDVVLRVHKPSTLSRDVPITPQAEASVALRLKVAAIARGPELGDFSLQANQIPPLNAFVRLPELQTSAGLPGKANLLLAGLPGTDRPAALPEDEPDALLRRAVRNHATLADLGLTVQSLTNGSAGVPTVEIRTDRIFLDAITTAVAVDDQAVTNARPILTYLVNQLRAGDRMVPYSMVTAAGPPWTPPGLALDQVVINQWLADELQLRAGDSLDLAYYLPESGARLVERTNRFRVQSVVPMDGVHADRSLMPEFPGLAKAESTHDWDAGFPLVHKIRDADEAYWKKYRGTPKAFISWAAGQALWTNRFGNATAIRATAAADGGRSGDGEAFAAGVEKTLLSRLTPSQFGLLPESVRAQALAASAEAQDFGGLFLGFSFFLILAALILMALLFQFGLEQRTNEVGALLALGFTPRRVRWIILAEGAALAFVGGCVGVAGGLVYAQAMLHGLTTIWRDAVGTSSLHFHLTGGTLVTGLISSAMVGVLTIALVLRRQARRPARELLAEGAGTEQGDALAAGNTSSGRLARGSAIGGGLVAAGLIGWALASDQTASAGLFFGAGSLLLISGLGFVALLLRRLQHTESGSHMSLSALGLRAATRRRKRSLASVSLLACGSFLIVAVGANRLDSGRDASKRSSGTGGFAAWGESALPVIRDLNTVSGREFYGLDEGRLNGVSVVPFRVRDGDEASCLNLNRAQQPRLLGVDPGLLDSRKAFTFSQLADGAAKTAPWLSLLRNNFQPRGGDPLREDEIPAIGDAASIQWALGRKVGDSLQFKDERGRAFRVRLVGAVANSILQGNLLIDEAEFVKRFPSESGHRMFLIDAPSNQPLTNVTATLTRGLQDVGLELTPATRRLAAFNAVQNTYLNTFQILGGLGLLLGSAGLGVVVLRNVLERRGELALLQAVGFRRRRLRRLILSEHGGLLGLGLAVGMVAALAAVLPVLLAPGAEVHYTALVLTLAGVLASGLVWTWLATRFALRGELLDSLRSE